MPFCPKCEWVPAIGFENLTSLSGKALRGIDKRTGQFRMKVNNPPNFDKDIIVQTYYSYKVSKPSEWKYSKRKGLYKIQERTARVFPELRRNDQVQLVGIFQEGNPFLPVIMNNSQIDITTLFINQEISIKKGVFSTFKITDPLYSFTINELEKIMDSESK